MTEYILTLDNPQVNCGSEVIFVLKTEKLVLEREAVKGFSKTIRDVLNGSENDLAEISMSAADLFA